MSSASLFHESLRSRVHRGLVFPLCLRWDMRLGGSYWCCWIGCGFLNQLAFFFFFFLFKQSWKNVVIKFVRLWQRGQGESPCSGSRLNLCDAAGKIPAYNSSTDEQRVDLSTAEVTQISDGGFSSLLLLLPWIFLHANHPPAVQYINSNV